MAKSAIEWIALILLVIGGLNWGLYGLFNLDLIAIIFGGIAILAKIIYVLVAIAAIYMIFMATKK